METMWLLPPRQPCNDFRHAGLVDLELLGDFRLRDGLGNLTNLSRIIHRQFGRGPASDIFRDRDRFQVVGIDARTVSADVVNRQPFRDRSDVLLVKPACGADGLTVDGDVCISVGDLALPHPAPGNGVNHVQRTRFALATPMMSINVSLGSPSNVSGLAVGLLRNWCLFTASAQAQARRVQSFSLRGQVYRYQSFSARRTTMDGLTATRNRAATVRAFSVILGTHFWSLLHRFRGVVPRAVCSSAGAFHAFQLYPIGG